jgi:hypothetical protein
MRYCSVGGGAYTLTLDRELQRADGSGNYGSPPPPTEQYRIFRQSRPVPGEPVLQLPKDIAVDISRDPNHSDPNQYTWHRMTPKLGNTGGGGPFDILFTASGQVVGLEARLGSRICLWVRDVSQNVPGPNVNNDPNATDPLRLPPGDNTLITVYTRSGQIAAHPVDPSRLTPNTPTSTNLWNPFHFTQDARSSGQ